MSATKLEPRMCASCGCSDLDPCPGGCSWVEPDVCSRCVALGHCPQCGLSDYTSVGGLVLCLPARGELATEEYPLEDLSHEAELEP